MDAELKLGFHRLARRWEDPYELMVAVLVAWVALVTFGALVAAVPLWSWLLLVGLGLVLVVLLHGPLTKLAGRNRLRRERLEQQSPQAPPGGRTA